MNSLTKLIFFSFTFFLILGLFFFYRPKWIISINKFARDRIFNDNLILLERRKKGVFFLLIAALLFYWGHHRSHYVHSPMSEKIISSDRLLYQSLQHLEDMQLDEAKMLCADAVARDPRNVEALYQLAAIAYVMHDAEQAKIYWSKASALDPGSPHARRFGAMAEKLTGAPFSLN